MVKLFDENGNEVEAFTQEDLDSKTKEAVDAYVEENPDKSTELAEAQTALEDANKKIEDAATAAAAGEGENEGQKKRLKDGKEKAETDLKEVTSILSKQIDDMKTGFLAGSNEKLLEKLSGGDAEVRKKIEFEAEQFNGDVNNEVELEARLTKAAHIVNASNPIPNFTDNISGSGERGDQQTHKESKQETDNSKLMRKEFGISEEDVSKFGGDAAVQVTNNE